MLRSTHHAHDHPPSNTPFRPASLTNLLDLLKHSSSQPTAESRTKTTFYLFPNLPTELRLLIWRLASPRNRSIHLNILTCNHPSRSAEALIFTAPVTLSIDRESRAETLRYYHYQSHFDSKPFSN